MVATEWHHVESPRPPTPPFYLSYRPSTVHVKTSHLPRRTLYIKKLMSLCILLYFVKFLFFPIQDATERSPLFGKLNKFKTKEDTANFFYFWKVHRMPFYINVF